MTTINKYISSYKSILYGKQYYCLNDLQKRFLYMHELLKFGTDFQIAQHHAASYNISSIDNYLKEHFGYNESMVIGI